MTVFTAEDYPVLEPGTYQATFDHTEESQEAGQFGFWIDWYFDTTTADGSVSVMGRSSLPDRWTRSTKARTWYEGIAGRELAKGETADTAKLKGSPVTLTLDVVKTSRGDERNSIVTIRRRAAAAKDAVAAPAAVADPEFEAWKREQAAGMAMAAGVHLDSWRTAHLPAEQVDGRAGRRRLRRRLSRRSGRLTWPRWMPSCAPPPLAVTRGRPAAST